MELPYDALKEKKFENTPKEFIFRYLKYLPWVILSLLIASLIGYIVLRYTPKEYSAKGQMIIKSENPVATGDEKFNSLFLIDQGPNLNNEMIILKSSSLIQRVVNELGLQTEYTSIGNVRSTVMYNTSPVKLEIINRKDSGTIAFTINIVDSKTYLLNDEENPRYFGAPIQNIHGAFIIHNKNFSFENFDFTQISIVNYPLDIAAERFVPSIMVQQTNEYTNILDVFFQSTDRQFAAEFVNALMEEYGKASREDKNVIAQSTIKFIDERLDSINNELSGVEGRLQKFQETNQGLALQAQSELIVTNLGDIDGQINALYVRKRIIEWLKEYVSDNSNNNAPVPVNLGVEEPTLAPLIAAYNEAQVKRAALLKSTPEQNPAIVELQVTAQKLRTDILETLRSVEAAYNISLNQLQKQFSIAQQKSTSIPGKARQLLNIERQQKIKEELYLLLLSKREEVAIGAAAVVPNSTILEKATIRAKLVAPIARSVYLKYVLLGLVIPLAIIALIEFLNDKVSSKIDIEKHTDAPIAGEIGRSEFTDSLIVTENNRSFITEQFRAIRTNLTYLASETKDPCILVTSSMSGEGKSFISTNIGAAYALADKKTLILEFDIRKPKVASNLGISTKRGISSFLVADEDLDDIVVKVPGVENLFILPCGVIPPNPSEMLLMQKVDELFRWAKKNYDIIIIDSAPVGVVSDAVTLGKYADATLYIIRQGYTLKRMVELVEKVYSQKRLPNMALVVNDVRAEGGYGYGYSYGYGYGYGNGKNSIQEYFVENKKVRNGFIGWLKRLIGK